MSGPLEGLKVLDLSRILAGPWATQLLADYGADVIKIERPGSGDDTRRWGPPWLLDDRGSPTDESAYFLSTNRNKRSVTVDIALPAGQAVIRDLARHCDVMLENFKVGTLRRYGLDYAALKAQDEALVYCSISAYGQTASRSQEPGYDAMIQAEAGLMSVTGESAAAGGEPRKVGVAVADIMTGMYAVTAILAALLQRRQSGVGQYIDLSLYDTQAAWLANQSMNYLIGDRVPERHGNAHPNIVPYQSFRTADGHLVIAVGNDLQFRACAECLGLDSLGHDARFRRNADRVEHREQLITLMQGRMAQESTEHWMRKLTNRQVPAAPINDLAAVYGGAYARERELVQTLAHPLAAALPTVSNPVRFSSSTIEYRAAPPLLGQHTHEVLREELGYTDERIRSLSEAGAV